MSASTAEAPVIVLGMHRSGTSCLAGCLQDLGLNMGPVNTRAPHNPKGNRENPRFWAVHDAVLARVGASWDRPPTEPVAWTPSEIAALRSVIEDDYAGTPGPWGFKDPRATVLLDGWFEVLPGLRPIASIRHPLAVAASLRARNGFDLARSMAVWRVYNRVLLDLRARRPFAIIDYDAPDYEARVRKAAGDLSLEADRPMPFRDDDLTHQNASGPAPAEVADLWDELQALAR